MQSVFRVGVGHDTHRFTAGKHLQLGGIRIDDNRSFLGHSDADVLLHAVCDALLGAAGLGDIGEFFPDTDPANRGRDSGEMLREIALKIEESGWKIGNVDCIVFLERPKLGSYKGAIRKRIAELLKIEPAQVGIKAKTGENVGPIGREEAACAECVALIFKQ